MLNKELLMMPSGKVLIGQFHFYTASPKAAVYWGAFDSDGIHRNGWIWHDYVNSGDAVYGLNVVRSIRVVLWNTLDLNSINPMVKH